MAIYRDEAGNIISRKKVNARNSEAKIRANNKYRSSHYKRLSLDILPADFALIDDYCKTHGISKAALIVRSVKYCIANNIDLTATEQPKDGEE